PRVIGRARALQMLVAAEKLTAKQALQIGLVDLIASDPVAESILQVEASLPDSGLARIAPFHPAGIPYKVRSPMPDRNESLAENSSAPGHVLSTQLDPTSA